MIVDMPRVVHRPSPNYTPTLIRHDLLVLHLMEGGYEGSVAWLCQPASRASVHICMNDDGSEVSQLVPLQFKSWGQVAFNGRSISMEVPGKTADGIPVARWKAAALIFGWLAREYGIPPIWAKGGQGRGVCQHHDLGHAGGDHVDVCGVGSPEWGAFMTMVQEAFDAFGPGALPPFLLHGLPQDHEIAPPSDAAPMPSHNGAMRAEIADRIDPLAHPTVSGYPDGSAADLQWRLNKAGAHLTVDGWAGEKTRAAVAHFQGEHRLFVDGVAGISTWTALRAATN